jgi:quinol monooxygenase YgiN
MSIIIAGYFRIDPAKTEQCKAAAIEMMRATRAEPGCRFYNITPDLEVAGLFHVSEEWESDAAIASHLKTPHMQGLKAALAGWGVQAVDIKRYDASEGKPLSL